MSESYSHTTRATGTVLTAAIYNADHDNHVLNNVNRAGGVDILMADVIANRPTAGTVNRYFISTDEGVIYRDTGSAWVVVLSDVPASGTFLLRANNLSDVDDATTSRTNLGAASQDDLDDHLADFDNPHQVTLDQLGLENIADITVITSLTNVKNAISREIDVTSGGAAVALDIAGPARLFHGYVWRGPIAATPKAAGFRITVDGVVKLVRNSTVTGEIQADTDGLVHVPGAWAQDQLKVEVLNVDAGDQIMNWALAYADE